MSTAAFAVLTELGHTPDYVAGHSLGEYSALVAAGSLAFSDAVRLVRKRGQYMQEAVRPGVGAMAALLKLPEGKLDAVLQEAAQGEAVSAANLNSPDQVVIAGHSAAVLRAIELAKAAGARRAVLLPVSAPFHCELMAPAKRELHVHLAHLLRANALRTPEVPVVWNVEAAATVKTPEEIARVLEAQVVQAVRWSASVDYCVAKGVTHFLELGVGGVLSGLIRQQTGKKSDLMSTSCGTSDEVKTFMREQQHRPIDERR